jgi:glycosyltransferase involved in cell wall biosynthesis
MSPSRDLDPVRIAHIATVDTSLRYFLLDQLLFFKDRGYEVITISSPGQEVPLLERAGIRHISVRISRRPFSPFRDLRSLFQLTLTLRKLRPDIVHTHSPKGNFLGEIAASLAGVPVIINTIHGYHFHDLMQPLKRRIYVLLERIAGRAADLVLSQSEEDRQTAIHERIAPSTRVKYLGNGIDTKRFDRNRLSGDVDKLVRDQVGLGDGPVVGFVGRLVREKGILDLFAAASNLLPDFPDLQLLVVGETDVAKRDAVDEDAADAYGVRGCTHFLGLRHDLPELYAVMDVFVLPSYREGLPRTAIEAMAMQVPCVLTDVRGNREVLKSGEEGVLVSPGDVAALTLAIKALLEDPSRAAAMGRKGRVSAETHWDERRVFEFIDSEYKRLISATSGARSDDIQP